MGHRGNAVVLGAGMAGLLAARVLAGHFERVMVVERDRLPGRPGFRPGVPQSRHLHVLLGRGLECLEQLFPGFEADLVEAGAPVVAGSESLWLNAAGWSRRYRSPIRLLGASRELVEWRPAPGSRPWTTSGCWKGTRWSVWWPTAAGTR